MIKKSKNLNKLGLLFAGLILSNSLHAENLVVTIPKDSDVLRILEIKTKEDYRDKFNLVDYKRINGYWKDKLNGKYIVNYEYKLISKQDIILDANISDVTLYFRLNLLKFNSNIYNNESFFKKGKISLKHTEIGWKEDDSLLGISF